VELNEFVRNALVQIAEGVREAQKEMDEKKWGTRIAPSRVAQGTPSGETQLVEFDVAVTVSADSGTSGKAGLQVFSVLEASGGKAKTSSRSEVSRIKFGILIALHQQ